jgi:photosystem II stability/assembly factor-like uncharacterized protein
VNSRVSYCLGAALLASCAVVMLIVGGCGHQQTVVTASASPQATATETQIPANASNFAWAVGEHGTLLRTTDGGQHWTKQRIPALDVLNSVSFADVHSGWAVGSDGAIIRSTDGGASWSSQTSSVQSRDISLTGIDALNPVTAWVVGDRVLETTDGGTDWLGLAQVESAGQQRPSGLAVAFADQMSGWIVGGGIYATIDGGAHWKLERRAPTGPRDFSADAIACADANHVWAVGSSAIGDAGGILVSGNGGVTWRMQRKTRWPLSAIACIDSKHLWAVGANLLFLSVDGGVHWTTQRFTVGLNDVAFANDQIGWLIGSTRLSGDVILGTRDGGLTWTKQASSSAYLQDITTLH